MLASVDKAQTFLADCIVIGGGTVGLMLTHDLMSKGLKVLLIEAGDDKHFESFNNAEFRNIGLPHNGISIGRSKGIGGTSNIWGGQLTEFSEADIKNTSFDQPTWPVSWKEIRKYYSAAYEKLGMTSVSPEESEMLDHSPEGTLEIFYTRWLKQPNLKFHFYEDLVNSNAVCILNNTVVTDLFFDDGKCNAIEVSSKGSKKILFNFRQVVLTNGTIEICRLLLMAKRNNNCPFSNNENIGRYFQDHINVRVGKVQHASKAFIEKFSNFVSKGEKLQPKIRLQPAANDQFLGMCGFFSFDSKVSHHIDNFKQFAKAILGRTHQKNGPLAIMKMMVKVVRAIPHIAPVVFNYIRKNRIYVPFNSAVSLTLQTQQISIPNSMITLSKDEMDDTGRPKAVLDWKVDGREFKEIHRFCGLLKKYLKDHHFGDLELEKWLSDEIDNINAQWLKHISDIYHHAGGTIMATNENSGVVDNNMKVFNTENLYIGGASVMPTSGFANISLTALALSCRLADHLACREIETATSLNKINI